MSSNAFRNTEFGKVPIDWTVGELGDYITTLTDYHANGSYKKLKENVELLDTEDYAVMIRTTNFEQNNFEKNEFKYITRSAYEYLNKSKVYSNDILMNKIANAGSVYFMPNLSKPVSLAMNLFLIRFDEKVINSKFGFYFLRNYEPYIKTRASGSVTKTITKENVRKLEIGHPEINEQEAIAATLSCLDEKIEVNNQINKTLEKMAQAIFKQWFVDFEFPNKDGEPYQSSGGEMVESELGLIPKGWEVNSVGDNAILVSRGIAPKYTDVSDQYVINQKCIRNGFL
ncbi:MAG: restriction endonuclease subunit S, partial [Firmicutes bacterium]|nr:restriction endonuclease subunit S [Bacillota bacterium]